jgi:hypothetical protein
MRARRDAATAQKVLVVHIEACVDFTLTNGSFGSRRDDERLRAIRLSDKLRP